MGNDVSSLALSRAPAAAEAPQRRLVVSSEPPKGMITLFGDALNEEVMSRRVLGRTQIIINKPEAIRHVLVENPDNYGRTPATIRLLYPVTGNGLILADGNDWREQRRAVAPAFAPRTMPIMARHVAAVTAERVAQMAAQAANGAALIDMAEEMPLLALEVAGRSMFSLDMAPFETRMRELLRSYGQRLGRPTVLDIILPNAIPTWRDFARWRFRRRWMRLIREIVAARQARPAGEPDLLDLMTSGPHDRPEKLADQVATMIAAGHATTAVALFWSLYVMTLAPGVQERVAAEAALLDLSPEGAADAIPRLTFTRAVVHEVLRLYPPAYLIVRLAKQADNAGDIPIPPGAVVLISPWILHRHRRLWTEPEVFDPARFLPDATPPDRFAYLPFGVGPRVCIGAQFALTEATLALAALAKAFRIEQADPGNPPQPVAGITLQPERPPPLFRLEVRSGAA